MATTFSNKVAILADFWSNHKDEEDFEDFVEYNDLGLPLAYLIKENLCNETDEGTRVIEETFGWLIEFLDIEDVGFESLSEIYSPAE